MPEKKKEILIQPEEKTIVDNGEMSTTKVEVKTVETEKLTLKKVLTKSQKYQQDLARCIQYYLDSNKKSKGKQSDYSYCQKLISIVSSYVPDDALRYSPELNRNIGVNEDRIYNNLWPMLLCTKSPHFRYSDKYIKESGITGVNRFLHYYGFVKKVRK